MSGVQASSPQLLFTLARYPGELSSRGRGAGILSASSKQPSSPVEGHKDVYGLQGFMSQMMEEAKRELLEGEAPAKEKAADMNGRRKSDDWYKERRLYCSSCNLAVRSTGVDRVGVRCYGCSRWFHDICAPRQVTQEQAQGSKPFYHCDSCQQLRERVLTIATTTQKEAAMAAQLLKAGKGGCNADAEGETGRENAVRKSGGSSSTEEPVIVIEGHTGEQGCNKMSSHTVVLLDLGRFRSSIDQAVDEVRSSSLTKLASQGHDQERLLLPKEFSMHAKSPKYEKMKEKLFPGAKQAAATAKVAGHGGLDEQRMESSVKSGEQGGLPGGSLAGGADQRHGACDTMLGEQRTPLRSAYRSLVPGAAGGIRDMRALACIFGDAYGPDSMDDIIEDDFGVLVRNDQGLPVCAATFNLFGADAETGHVRLMSLATDPKARRQGHSRFLLETLEALLASAGVPRVVAMYPRKNMEQEAYVDKLFRRGMQYQDLEIDDLIAYKTACFPLYHKDFTFGQNFVTKELPAARSG